MHAEGAERLLRAINEPSGNVELLTEEEIAGLQGIWPGWKNRANFLRFITWTIAHWRPGNTSEQNLALEHVLGADRCQELAQYLRARARFAENWREAACFAPTKWRECSPTENMQWIRKTVKSHPRLYQEQDIREVLSDWSGWVRAAGVSPEVAALVHDIDASISSMPEPHQSLVRIRFLGDSAVPQTRAAEALGISERTLRTREGEAIAYLVADVLRAWYHDFPHAWAAYQDAANRA